MSETKFSPQKKSVYSPGIYSPKSNQRVTELLNRESLSKEKKRTMGIKDIEELAEKHYNQAMKYVYKKNKAEENVQKKKDEIAQFGKEKVTEMHTFKPLIKQNKYNKKIEGEESKEKRYIELYKLGATKNTKNCKGVIENHVKTLRSSKEKPFTTRDYELERINKTLNNSFESSASKKDRNITSASRLSQESPKKTHEIPGVKKFYLNQVKAQVSKINGEKLLFKGNDVTGFIF